jgi:hypothetical protein
MRVCPLAIRVLLPLEVAGHPRMGVSACRINGSVFSSDGHAQGIRSHVETLLRVAHNSSAQHIEVFTGLSSQCLSVLIGGLHLFLIVVLFFPDFLQRVLDSGLRLVFLLAVAAEKRNNFTLELLAHLSVKVDVFYGK